MQIYVYGRKNIRYELHILVELCIKKTSKEEDHVLIYLPPSRNSLKIVLSLTSMLCKNLMYK